jgi:predicted secreted protein
MAKVRGEDVVLIMTDDLFKVICARSITFDINRESIETSITGSGNFRTFKQGAIEWSGSIEGLTFIANGTIDDQTIESFYLKMFNNIPFYIRWYEEDENNEFFLQKEGFCYIDTINETSSFDNMATFNATFRGTGPITITTGLV